MNLILSNINKSEKNKLILKNRFFNLNLNYEKNYELIIVTTAITRPQLHKKSFSNYAKMIPKDIKIGWVINVDYVNIYNIEEDKEEKIKKTIDNIKNIFKEHNVTFYFSSSINGNFNKAVRCIVKKTVNIISKDTKKILYLEDDWYFIKSFNFKNNLNNNVDATTLTCQIHKKIICFQPSICSPFIWYDIFFNSLKNNESYNIDPEFICQKTNSFMVY